MNKTQLVKIAEKAGVTQYEISGRGATLEIEVSERDSKKLRRAGLTWGGYKTGYGAWVLQAGYVARGDYSNVASAWHY